MPKAPRLLTPRQDEFVDGVRHALGDLRAALVRAGADATDEHTVQSSLQQLDDFFLLVVVGEFQRGQKRAYQRVARRPDPHRGRHADNHPHPGRAAHGAERRPRRVRRAIDRGQRPLCCATLVSALTTQFEIEIERSVRRVEDGIAPYVQFVEGERAGLTDRHEELTAIEARLDRFTSDIQNA